MLLIKPFIEKVLSIIFNKNYLKKDKTYIIHNWSYRSFFWLTGVVDLVKNYHIEEILWKNQQIPILKLKNFVQLQ